MRCPTCRQLIPQQKVAAKVCRRCQEPIRRHDKWRFVTSSAPGRHPQTLVEHRHCEEPEAYVRKA